MQEVPTLNFSESLYGGIEGVKKFIREQNENSIVYIGCDSVRKSVKGKASAVYGTVIVVRMATGVKTYRGCHLFCSDLIKLPDYGKVIKSGKIANLRTRMMQEVTFALEAFALIEDVLEDREWEIHIDINSRPECESHVALADARGYVLGVTGKEPEFKPVALAASFAADAHAHGHLH